ncbi:hypothetical protein AYO21_07330 [Fonsecaea monophora]|uniref:Uncharacterized protein n=1 Tax=Fonsecaea monophora TaxID=254056 RepID=A0A177F2N6_9EURO|nr:hypothetical protein AYO21_07330 [Fonsecaea monophora]KAH0847280.1 hypothetical protein FOPE_00369 [Fonsecaea pedrosoi]OAG38508.1 hypothetical protein AYO21_07330 [Fonsecaea monophora]
MASDSESTLPPPLARSWESIMPWEIRTQIFSECIKNRSVSLLYANKQHYTAFRPLLYENFVLSFVIDPSATDSLVDILGQNGRVVCAAPPHPDYASIVEYMPTDLFQKIEIFIDAPDPDDPGQLVRAWKQTTGLLAALLPRWKTAEAPMTMTNIQVPRGRRSKTALLPPMIVQFRGKEGQDKKWTSFQPSLERRVWNHSVPSFGYWDPEMETTPIKHGGIHSDLGIIMTAFLRVRGVASLSFHFPGEVDAPPKDVAYLMREVDRLTAEERPFGLYGQQNDDDYMIGIAEDNFHLWLDYLLDDMQGPSAALVRSDRAETWCSEYDFLMKERLYNCSLGNILKHHLEKQYTDRCVARILLTAAIHVFCSRGLGQYRGEEQSQRMATTKQRHWSFWTRHFPRGIACKSDNELWPVGVSTRTRRSWLADGTNITCTHWSQPVLGRPPVYLCPVCGDQDAQGFDEYNISDVYEAEQDLLVEYLEASSLMPPRFEEI